MKYICSKGTGKKNRTKSNGPAPQSLTTVRHGRISCNPLIRIVFFALKYDAAGTDWRAERAQHNRDYLPGRRATVRRVLQRVGAWMTDIFPHLIFYFLLHWNREGRGIILCISVCIPCVTPMLQISNRGFVLFVFLYR